MSAADRWQIIVLDETTSTQDEGRRLVSEKPGIRRAIRARRQSSGRGRLGNDWHSPEGGLWCTLTLPVPDGPDPFHNLLLALAARDSVASSLGNKGLRLALKWPNDLMIGSRKWGGVLAEIAGTSTSPEVLFGIGLNLDVEQESLRKHPGMPKQATSIRAEFGHSPSPAQALQSILSNLDRLLEEDHAKGGRERNRLRVAEVLDTIGRHIHWKGPADRTGEGEATGISPEGALIVDRTSPGPPGEELLRSAEISHVRTC
ncbi:MAG: biotin--[acetyl-CoA-carboxylase] ligase [Planctomycetota bacterium]|jgi:BirA family biotin operon repressor/biotin-[acetyl-CoA-carboxylase] ligase